MGSSQAGVPGSRLNPKTVRMADITASASLTDDHFAGNRIVVVNSATAVNITIPNTLTAKEPLTIINVGAGSPTIVAASGTTVNAPGAGLTFNQQYGGAVIFPDHNNDDAYWAMGDLS